jgi:hypothetical protein
VQGKTIDEWIAMRAYELWLKEGCPEGQHTRHWLEAERQLRDESTLEDANPEEG